ncbi:hypothetical protein HHTV1_40 [Haloarcula hispanica tailed virus 1]|uniref:Uncharacterized protein n=1 Tax=Haloarcula hispanica tailed virus 1 TaxID=1273750 RepID=R4T8S0_9CAUD|nr:hypothetical protein M198_gp40 [Haloarcula hispanica tailed virus 1]AGM11295.1 hypothetical protein HHTV1_40 [Haloarcula hispanica tailed virus 1]
MPDTQAFSVDWTVTIQPEGDVSEDVSEITLIEEQGVDSATVKLDTSKRPHALEEQRDISIVLDDGNTTKRFDGFTDSISDDETRPIVTVDARTPIGLLDDGTAAGVISEDNLFQVIDAILDQSAGQIREISFDPTDLEDQYGTFAAATNFGKISVAHVPGFGVNYDNFEQRETTSQGKEAEITFDNYNNGMSTTYTMDITGNDQDGNTVTASVDLPPGSSVQDAFGQDTFKLALSGGNELWDEVTGITTDIPNFNSGLPEDGVYFSANIWNYVKTDWRFQLDSLTSVRQAISRIVQYISGLDSARDWEYYVDDASDELIVQPESAANPSTYVFREGDNVLKPVATRDLDGVRNFIKVVGSNNVNFWAWAYNGDFQWSLDNPFDTGEYPDAGVVYDSSPGNGQNDIDQINIRGEKLQSNSFSSWFQAIEIGQKALREFYRTPVTGQAPISGLHPATVGDRAEVYYPSRGIPQKVADNTYQIEKVETRITPEEAKTMIDFGTSKPNLADQIGAGSSMIRNDISGNVAQYATSVTTSSEVTNELQEAGAFPIVGELISQNDDGTWQVEGEDGTTYDNVRVI